MTPKGGNRVGRDNRRGWQGSLGGDENRGDVEEKGKGSKYPRADHRCRYCEDGSEMDANEGDEGGCNQARADPVECPTWKGAFRGARGREERRRGV